FRSLSNIKNVHLIPPQDYLSFLFLMAKSHFIVTDSGGVQEEAPSLNKPVIITRENTERPEAVQAGAAVLVGTDGELLYDTAAGLLDETPQYLSMSQIDNPYGDGRAVPRIISFLEARM
ncbi:MAG: UDP-N-acetylglucosamine 2-epimerase, partial [Victivallaceae bacterium]|nr:UDP-N-acetylglucosamine 2-epimerase [Victivallaceae bacterium]